MSTSGPFPPEDAEPLVRPFFHHGPGSGPADAGTARADLRNEVRPYLMTGGRTSAALGVNIAMETVLQVSDLARSTRIRATFERASVLAECVNPRSVAEVAARAELPLRVALVLVSDLVAEGLLEATAAAAQQADDIAFLERLIHGVSAL